ESQSVVIQVFVTDRVHLHDGLKSAAETTLDGFQTLIRKHIPRAAARLVCRSVNGQVCRRRVCRDSDVAFDDGAVCRRRSAAKVYADAACTRANIGHGVGGVDKFECRLGCRALNTVAAGAGHQGEAFGWTLSDSAVEC